MVYWSYSPRLDSGVHTVDAMVSLYLDEMVIYSLCACMLDTLVELYQVRDILAKWILGIEPRG
jgi:hypothetical protein